MYNPKQRIKGIQLMPVGANLFALFSAAWANKFAPTRFDQGFFIIGVIYLLLLSIEAA